MKVRPWSLAVAVCLTSLAVARAEGPRSISFQGILKTSAGQPVNAATAATIGIYAAAMGGSPLWTEQQTITPKNGVFSTTLGSTAHPLGLPFDAPYYVGVSIGGTEMTPRSPLAAVPYALALPYVSQSTDGATRLRGRYMVLDLASTGGGQLFVTNIQNDSSVWLEGFGYNGSGNAGRIAITGAGGNPIPRFTLNATVSDLWGKIGIGLPNPEYPLDVNGTAQVHVISGDALRIAGANVPMGIRTDLGGNAPLLELGVNYANAGENTGLRGGAVRIDARDNSPLFQFVSRSAGSASRRLVASLTEDGKLGLGTGAPTSSLTVRGGDIELDQTRLIGMVPNDRTSYLGVPLGNYSLSWQGAAGSVAPEAWLSGWGGLKFFSGGAPRLAVAAGGNVGIGTMNPAASLDVNGNVHVGFNTTTGSLDIVGGSDVAEPYNIAAAGETAPAPGMVVAIDPDRVGHLRVCATAYDRTVAGIISGANGVQPGIVLRQKGTVADGALPVASSGRVWCCADADAGGPIVPGDLLTTSTTPGHAMKAADEARRNGAVLGKAMSRLDSGQGMVLVLVTLQ